MKHLTAAILALGLVLGAMSHAQAEPISTVIGLTALIGGLGFSTAVAGAIGGFLITLAAGLGLNLLSAALLRKRGSADVGGTTGKMQTGGVVPRSFPVGEKALVTHSLVYWNSFGQDGKTPNAYVAFVFALSDLPVGGGRAALQELWPNGTKATWNPEATPGTYGIAIPEFAKDGTDYMWVEVFDGTQTEADPLLVSLFENDTNWPYQDTRIGTGVVYVRVICRLNRDLYSGYPSFKFVVKGVPFYDAREDDTAGGEGDQRWSDDSTWAATENPIAVSQNVIRGIRYNGEWFFGGQTVSAAQLPSSAWFAAANECDAEIENEDETTEAQFRCAGEIRLDMEPADVIDDLLRACNGRIGEIGGVYKPHVGAAGTAVLSITDDDIRTDEDQTFEPFFGLQDIVNSINAKYIEPGEGWTAKDAPALVDAALEAEDGGRRQPVDLQYEYVPFARQVQRQNRATLTDYRRERRHVLPLAPEAWRLEPAIDFIAWTSERNGYTSKLFSVEGATDMDGYLVGVTLKEVDPSDYDDWTSVVPDVLEPPIVLTPSQGIAGADIDGVTVQGAGGRAKPGALLQWNGDDQDDVRAVAFQIRVDGETDLTYSGETPESAVAQGTYIVTANLNGATDYEGRLKFVPFSGRATTWSDWIAFTTPDVRVTEADLDAAITEAITTAGANASRALADAQDLIAALSGDEGRAQAASARLNVDLSQWRGQLTGAVLSAQAAVEDMKGVLGDLGWERIGPGGASRFRAIDVVNNGLTTLTSQVNLLAGRVDFILAAESGDLSAIDGQLSTIIVTLDALQELVDATVTSVNVADGEIDTLSARISAAEEQITLLASSADLEELQALIEAAQIAISSGVITAETIAGIQRTQEQIAEGVGGLIARLQGLSDQAFETASSTRLELTSSINDLGEAQARFEVELASVQGNASANLRQAAATLASATEAVASNLAALTTAVNHPTTGLATKASASSVAAVQSQVDGQGEEISSLATRADTLEATAESLATSLAAKASITSVDAVQATVDAQGDEIEALTTTVSTHTSQIGDNAAAIEDLEATSVSEAGSAAIAEGVLEAYFGGGSANVKMRLAALATPTGYDALFQIEASVTGAGGTFKPTGMLIGVLTVSGTQIGVVEFVADRFRIKRPSDGATVLGWDSDDEVLSIFGGTYVGGAFRSENGRLVIDGGDEPLITFKNTSGDPVLLLGYY